MTTSLQPCPACSRHIRITEESCPFCAASVVGLLKAPAPLKFPGRMSRAALITASTLAAVSACAGEDDGDDQGSGGAMTDSGGSEMGTGGDEMGAGGVVYGTPPSGGADQGTGGDAAGSGGLDVGVPEYGISPAGGNPGTGGEPATGTGGDIVGPVYGAPPVE